jgi:enoyl-CoA hydratase
MAVSTSEVSISRHGGVAVVTLQAPERRNLLSARMVSDLREAFDRIEADDSVHAVVLTGAGSAFCAGADLATLEAAAQGQFVPVREVYDGFLRVLDCPLPTIAAVNGPAVGAGFNLALACDVRIAAIDARFDTRFTRLHIHPGGGHTWLLIQAVGRQLATMACLFGQEWDARQAWTNGLVAEVCPADELLTEAIALGRRLDDHEPEFVRRVTSTLRTSATTTHHADALAAETEAQQWSTTRPAFLDGVRRTQARIRAKSQG